MCLLLTQLGPPQERPQLVMKEAAYHEVPSLHKLLAELGKNSGGQAHYCLHIGCSNQCGATGPYKQRLTAAYKEFNVAVAAHEQGKKGLESTTTQIDKLREQLEQARWLQQKWTSSVETTSTGS
jgi:hypothetical protein